MDEIKVINNVEQVYKVQAEKLLKAAGSLRNKAHNKEEEASILRQEANEMMHHAERADNLCKRISEFLE